MPRILQSYHQKIANNCRNLLGRPKEFTRVKSITTNNNVHPKYYTTSLNWSIYNHIKSSSSSQSPFGHRKRIELRSDTFTSPCSQMRSAISNALVGDDVFEADPTVKKLEDMTAALLGKEAGLFVSSGTMGNLIGLGVHCKRGEEIIVGNRNHIFVYEGGGASALLGIIFHTIPTLSDGTLNPEDILGAIREEDPHYPRTKLVTVENTQNKANGQPLSVAYMDQVSELCKENNLIFHVDGARLMNASIALNEDVSRVVNGVDSISLCLSKGLGALVGSVLVGEKDFIYEAKRLRKVLGGGMRQAGVIASAGIYALENNIERLRIDHDNAKLLAHRLSEFPGIHIKKDQIKSNILYFDLKDPNIPQPSNVADEKRYLEHNQQVANRFVQDLATEFNIYIGAPSQGKMRAVTSLEVNEEDVTVTANAMEELLSKYFDKGEKGIPLNGLNQEPKLMSTDSNSSSPLYQNS